MRSIRDPLHFLPQINALLTVLLLLLLRIVDRVVLAVHEEARECGLAHAGQADGDDEEFADGLHFAF